MKFKIQKDGLKIIKHLKVILEKRTFKTIWII